MGQVLISAIRPELVNDIWPRVAPLIQAAIDYGRGETTTDHMRQSCLSGGLLLIVAHRGPEILAAITLEIIDKPLKRICGIVTAGGGELDAWLDDFMAVVVPLAKEHGASELMITGRKGWERTMKSHGFEHAYSVLARAI